MCAIKDIYGEIRAASITGLAFVVDHMLAVICPADETVKTVTSNGLHTRAIRVGDKNISATGMLLLTQIYAPTTPSELRQLEQVEVLRRVWVLQFYSDDDQTRWRRQGNTPPGERILTSPYDPDARMSRKRNTTWVGYKVHLTESCDAERPHLITHVETTAATTADHAL